MNLHRLRMTLAARFRAWDSALFLGWSFYSHATGRTRRITFPRLSLYVVEPIASWLEGEKCWLVRGWEIEAAEREEATRKQEARTGATQAPQLSLGKSPPATA